MDAGGTSSNVTACPAACPPGASRFVNKTGPVHSEPGGRPLVDQSGEILAGGGTVRLEGDATAVVASTLVSDSGTVAVGTTLARATGGSAVTDQPVSKTVSISPGALVAANATKGGPSGGNGGMVEISSAATVDMTGATVRVGAPAEPRVRSCSTRAV
jgi:hypothetical protein